MMPNSRRSRSRQLSTIGTVLSAFSNSDGFNDNRGADSLPSAPLPQLLAASLSSKSAELMEGARRPKLGKFYAFRLNATILPALGTAQ